MRAFPGRASSTETIVVYPGAGADVSAPLRHLSYDRFVFLDAMPGRPYLFWCCETREAFFRHVTAWLRDAGVEHITHDVPGRAIRGVRGVRGVRDVQPVRPTSNDETPTTNPPRRATPARVAYLYDADVLALAAHPSGHEASAATDLYAKGFCTDTAAETRAFCASFPNVTAVHPPLDGSYLPPVYWERLGAAARENKARVGV